jgi:polar amino acid transport system substrate-binding protein
MKKFRLLSFIILVALLASACAPTATATSVLPAATSVLSTATLVPPTATPLPPTATKVPPTATTAPPTATLAPTSVAQIPPDKLSQKGRLMVCSDIPYPPQEFIDDQGNPQGVDIDLGTEISNRLGLKVQFVNSIFESIIAAVNSGKCDIIMSAMNITDSRKKQVSMIPYFQAGQALMVVKGNPKNINVPLDLCGQPVAVESGTTNADWLQSAGDYKDKGGMVIECQKASKKPPVVTVSQKDSDSFQQLQSGKVVAYATDSPVAFYYIAQHGDQFQLAGPVIDPIAEGIVVPCGKEDCTSAPLSEVGKAVETAFRSMVTDGAYLKILTKWGVTNSAIK